MRLPPDRAALEERNGEGRKTVVDHDQRANALAFMLGDKYSTTVKFRRVSKFAREVLGMHRTYLRECQFPKQGFANKKIDMVSDMIQVMIEIKRAGKYPTSNMHKDVSEKLAAQGPKNLEQEKLLHPRDNSPPCILHRVDSLEPYQEPIYNGISTLWDHQTPQKEVRYSSGEERQHELMPNVCNAWHIDTASWDDITRVIPQTTTNPLFTTVPEEIHKYIPSIDPRYNDLPAPVLLNHETNHDICPIKVLESRVQQALSLLRELSTH